MGAPETTAEYTEAIRWPTSETPNPSITRWCAHANQKYSSGFVRNKANLNSGPVSGIAVRWIDDAIA